jgi:hypothetical protein
MHPNVVTKDPTAVEKAVQFVYLSMFPGGNRLFIPQVFGWAIDCFTGRHSGYQAIDAKYHDFEHTLQGTLCMSMILHGRHKAGVEPVLPQRIFELGIMAILLHDTGYLKKTGDNTGTGAKYTVTHVRRSAEFAAELLPSKGFNPQEIAAIQNMILCTGINADLKKIPFQSEIERIVGYALATADLLGQMAAEDYVEKLPVLYAEFAEAAAYDSVRSKSVGAFASAPDLVQKTPAFWEKFVLPRLENDFLSLHNYLRDPKPPHRNHYLERIEANIERVRKLTVKN